MKNKICILTFLIVIFSLCEGVNAQSLLNPEQPTREERIAQTLLRTPSQMRGQILTLLDDRVRLLWDAKDPQGVLDAMGPSAGELFRFNSVFAQMLSAFLSAEGDEAGLARLSEILSRVPEHRVNEDGTVTLLVGEP